MKLSTAQLDLIATHNARREAKWHEHLWLTTSRGDLYILSPRRRVSDGSQERTVLAVLANEDSLR